MPHIYWLEGSNPKDEKNLWVLFDIEDFLRCHTSFLVGIFFPWWGESTAAVVWIFNQVCWLLVVFYPQRSLGILYASGPFIATLAEATKKKVV